MRLRVVPNPNRAVIKRIVNLVKQTGNDAVNQLCPACGLCCNGVLFGDVELQPEDNAKSLAALGLNLFRKGKKQCFKQPCACFDGKWCRIYGNRPERCHTFECRLLKQVQAGHLTVAAALKTIGEARRRVETVQKLVRQLGHTDEAVPLNRRYAAVVAAPIDLAADDEWVERRSTLIQAVDKLVKLLEADVLR